MKFFEVLVECTVHDTSIKSLSRVLVNILIVEGSECSEHRWRCIGNEEGMGRKNWRLFGMLDDIMNEPSA